MLLKSVARGAAAARCSSNTQLKKTALVSAVVYSRRQRLLVNIIYFRAWARYPEERQRGVRTPRAYKKIFHPQKKICRLYYVSVSIPPVMHSACALARFIIIPSLEALGLATI